ncbi:MAG: type I glyceraldehyde-3-phosphate dehydrogenase [Bacilli bacterium]|nr:type I glyceraldehyde-3-phosphate dehydrogenase [Bacilli bacterium]
MIRVAINGFGRIGRLALRRIMTTSTIEIVAINDLTDPKTLAYLLKYDTAQGVFDGEVSYDEESITVNGKKIKICKEPDPENLPWKELNVDIVLECTGIFKTREKANKHIIAGAKKVLISAPSDKDINTIVYGVNEDIYNKDENIYSAASCTTNAIAPVLKVLNDNYTIKVGYMNTVHAYTNDQSLLDLPNKKGDLRRSRAAASNIVPTSTGAAKAIGIVIPELDGKLNGSAFRVPTVSGSIAELTLVLEKKPTKEEINELMKKSANQSFAYSDEEIVSSDIVGRAVGSIFDATLTEIIESDTERLVKVCAWYDNENGYTSQLIRVLEYIGERL